MPHSIPYGKQEITPSDIEAVVSSLTSDYLTQGPKVAEFEEKFAAYIGCKYAVAVSNGTAALHLSALALRVKAGDKILCTPITFAASSNCILYCGGTVEFVDIDPYTYTMDLDLVEEKLNANPKGTYKGIVTVDFAGYPVDTERLKKLADLYGLWVLEDACHAPGAYYLDSSKTKVKCGDGRFTDLSVFSFHPVKHIACGEGGMITTNDAEHYRHLLNLRTHGINKNFIQQPLSEGSWFYEMTELGFNYRIPDILCSLGISQLSRADKNISMRRQIADRYTSALSPLYPNIITPKYPEGHGFHLYVIMAKNRLEIYNFLREKMIFCQVHYIPVHTLLYYQELGFKKGSLPVAEKYYEGCLSIPMYPSLSLEDQEFVIDTIKEFCTKEYK